MADEPRGYFQRQLGAYLSGKVEKAPSFLHPEVAQMVQDVSRQTMPAPPAPPSAQDIPSTYSAAGGRDVIAAPSERAPKLAPYAKDVLREARGMGLFDRVTPEQRQTWLRDFARLRGTEAIDRGLETLQQQALGNRQLPSGSNLPAIGAQDFTMKGSPYAQTSTYEGMPRFQVPATLPGASAPGMIEPSVLQIEPPGVASQRSAGVMSRAYLRNLPSPDLMGLASADRYPLAGTFERNAPQIEPPGVASQRSAGVTSRTYLRNLPSPDPLELASADRLPPVRGAATAGPRAASAGPSMGEQMGKGYVPKGFWEGATIGGAPASEEASSLRKAAGAAGLAGAALTGGLGTWLRRTPAAIPVIEAGGIAEGVMNPESRFNQAARRTRENVREAYRTEGLPAAIAQQIGSIAPMTYETLGAAGAPFESMAGSAGRMAGSVLRNLAVGAGISESPTQAMARAREIYERDIAPTRPRQLPQISVPGAPSPAQNAPSLATAAAGAPSVAGRVTPGAGRPGATPGQQRGELDLSDMSFKEAFKTARDKAEQLGVEPTGRFLWHGNAYQTNVGPARGRERYVPESQQTRLGNLPQLADAIAPTPQPTPAPAGDRITEVLPRSAPVTPAAPTAAARPQGVLESLPDYAARQKVAQGYLGSRLAAGEGSRDRPIQLNVNAELTPETQRYLERHPEHRLASANPNLQREYVMIMRQLDELGVTEKEIRDATTTSTRDEISGGSLKGTVEHFVPDKFGGHFTGGRFWAPRQGERSGEKTVTGTRTERTDKKSTALDLLADWNRRNEEWNARQEKAEAVKPSAAEMSAQAKQNYKVLLLAERQARADKNFAVADQIKQQIADIEAAEAAFSR